MTTNKSMFNAAAQVENTRKVMGSRIGEIIEQVVGDARIRELFDAAAQHPDEYADKPTGMIALQMGVVTQGTKDALLIAQAAERTFRLAEKAETLAAEHNDRVKRGASVGESDIVGYDDPVFKYVGSEKDPPHVQRAQATWMAAQMLLNNEISSIDGSIANPNYLANSASQGVSAANGFKKAAAELYAEASQLMVREGHASAAAKLSAVSETLAKTAGNGPTPTEVMQNLDFDFVRGGQSLCIALNDPQYLETQPIQAVFEKLARLTAQPRIAPSTGAAPRASQGNAP
jgi:hypothetical protein